MNINEALGGMGARAVAGSARGPGVPSDPTVGEYLRECIVDMQARIRALENAHASARRLGILDVKISEVRECIGW